MNPSLARSMAARKIAHFLELGAAELALLEDAAARSRSVAAGTELMSEGGAYPGILLIEGGWLCRYKLLQDGRRQIVNFLLPGDVFDIGALLFRTADQSVSALTPVRYSELTRDNALDFFGHHPRVAVALTWSAAQEAAIFAEHIVNVGRRSALERLAHIILELHRRLLAVGLANGEGFEFPLTQAILADALGLTPVHVSRTLRRLRDQAVIEIGNGRLRICDHARLREIGSFHAAFLHLRRAPTSLLDRLDSASLSERQPPRRGL